MKLYAGVDGGQTATQAAIADERGAILGRGQGGPANHVDEPGAEERLGRAVGDALTGALRNAGLPTATLFEAVHVALTGEIEPRRTSAVGEVVRAVRLTVGHDAPAAWMAAFRGEPGVAVIAGTGSVAYGRNAKGEDVRVGGWGYLFGDQGSAFWLAAEAIRRALDVADRGRDTALARAACQHFAAARLGDIPANFYRRALSRETLAGFAPTVTAMAHEGDVGAQSLVEEGGRALAGLVLVAFERLASQGGEAAIVGGLAADPLLRSAFERELRARGVRVREGVADPVLGALWLAMEPKREDHA